MPDLMHCPFCGSITFYVENDDGLVFFHVAPDLTLLPTRSGRTDPAGLKPDVIFCASCSWSGTLSELVP